MEIWRRTGDYCATLQSQLLILGHSIYAPGSGITVSACARYHGLEAMQCMVERRRGGESGMCSVQTLVSTIGGPSIPQNLRVGESMGRSVHRSDWCDCKHTVGSWSTMYSTLAADQHHYLMGRWALTSGQRRRRAVGASSSDRQRWRLSAPVCGAPALTATSL